MDVKNMIKWLMHQRIARALRKQEADIGLVSLGDRLVTTQTFNAIKGKRSDVALVFIPGFTSIPLLQSPGMVGKVAKEQGWDFVRFYHPDLVEDFNKITYDRMLDDVNAVIRGLPHKKIVLVGSSFGAGMLPFVADRANQDKPGRVAHMFGWMATPPKALRALIERQKGWKAFGAGKTEMLKIRSKTLPRAIKVTHEQVASVIIWSLEAYPRFKGYVGLHCGMEDPVALMHFSSEMLKGMKPNALKEPDTWSFTSADCGHRVDPQEIRKGLEAIAARMTPAKPSGSSAPCVA